MEWLGILRGAIALIKDIWGLKDRISGKALPEPKEELLAQENEALAVARCFIELFAAHGVTRTQIPAFFDHGLTLATLIDNETLLQYLTETILNDACELFAVRREWLDGLSDKTYPLHGFYKSLENYKRFLDALEAKTPLRQCYACAHTVEKSKDANIEHDAVFIIAEPIGRAGGNDVYRFHICNNWRLSYWKSRGYFAACAAHSWKRGLTMTGAYSAFSRINQLGAGLAVPKVNEAFGGKWYPEDFASVPEKFLSNLPEGQHEQAAAIAFWLKLHEQGWMEFGYGYAEKMAAELRELNS